MIVSSEVLTPRRRGRGATLSLSREVHRTQESKTSEAPRPAATHSVRSRILRLSFAGREGGLIPEAVAQSSELALVKVVRIGEAGAPLMVAALRTGVLHLARDAGDRRREATVAARV